MYQTGDSTSELKEFKQRMNQILNNSEEELLKKFLNKTTGYFRSAN